MKNYSKTRFLKKIIKFACIQRRNDPLTLQVLKHARKTHDQTSKFSNLSHLFTFSMDC